MREVVLDKSYLDGATTSAIADLCDRYAVLMPQDLFFELMTTSADSQQRCFSKLPNRDSPVASWALFRWVQCQLLAAVRICARYDGALPRDAGTQFWTRAEHRTMRLLLIGVVLLTAVTAGASDTALSGSEGHPRARFPLGVYAAPTGEASLDAVVQRALDDWNAMSQQTLGVQAFNRLDRADPAQVVVAFEPPPSTRLMGQTQLGLSDGVIALPVRIVVFAPTARGETSRETLLYQVLAHELGHALGLGHTRDPRSLMCCVAGSVDFNDPRQRQAYIDARRHPNIASVREQLMSHYEKVWARRD